MFTISAVVLLHLGVIAVLVGVNGCRTTTGFEKPGDLSAYNGTAVNPGSSASVEPTSFNEVPVALPPPAPRGGKMGSGATHTVVRGDTLWSVSRREGVSVQQLANANGLQANAVLREGQKLTIPSADAPSGAPAAAPRASAPSTAASAPAAPAAPRASLTVDAGGFGGFGNADPAATPAATPAAPATPAPAAPTEPAPAAPAPAAPAPAPASSTLSTGESGFGGFGAR